MLHSHHHHPTSHSHGQDCAHSHAAPADFGRAYVLGIVLNLGFVIAEIIYGLWGNSLALLADAGHNAGDTLGLFMAWGATMLARKEPSARYTYGLGSSSILAALGNAMLLLIACGGIGVEALRRLWEPQPVQSMTMILVAGVGIAVNGFTALLFMRGRKSDLNVRGAFMHMAGDAGVSLAVVLGGLVVLKTGWQWIDPVMSLLVTLFILIGAWGLMRDSFDLALHATPRNIRSDEVKKYLTSLPQVEEVHDLHIWAMSTTQTALSAHLLMAHGHPGDAFLKTLTHELEHRFSIGHSTVQLELGDDAQMCKLAPDHVV